MLREGHCCFGKSILNCLSHSNFINCEMQKTPPDISPHLLWEYDLSQFDWDAMKVLVVERVVTRGWPKDWKGMIDYYGYDEVREAIKKISFLDDQDIAFVCAKFDLKETELL